VCEEVKLCRFSNCLSQNLVLFAAELNTRQQADPGRRVLLLQLALTAAVAGPSSARDFIVPLDSTGRLPPGAASFTTMCNTSYWACLCHRYALLTGYEDLTRRLVNALQDSISADINGASENEVRKRDSQICSQLQSKQNLPAV